jgi:glycosyltransferase involved in cell wall biosynthesis
MTAPLVSVVITAHDMARWLPATLTSVFAQTHPRLDVIIVDDGSRDDLDGAIAPLRDRLSLLRQPHRGLGVARNLGLAAALGDWIAFVDADDLWRPETVETQLGVAGRHPEAGLVVCDGIGFSGTKTLVPRLIADSIGRQLAAAPGGELVGDLLIEMLAGPIACPAQALMPRATVDRLGAVVDHGGAVDFDYYLRVAGSQPVVFHDRKLVGWRYRPEAMTGRFVRRPFQVARIALPVLEDHLPQLTGPARAAAISRIAQLEAELALDQEPRGLSVDPRRWRRLLRRERVLLRRRLAAGLPGWLVNPLVRRVWRVPLATDLWPRSLLTP